MSSVRFIRLIVGLKTGETSWPLVNYQLSGKGGICPGHSHIPGNDSAHNLAQQATRKGAEVTSSTVYPMLQSVALEQGRKMFLSPPLPWVKPQTGKFTYSFDKALPGKHTLDLYNGKSHVEAATLCQLRSCMCKLNKYLARIGAVEEDVCSCGRESESVDHFLFRCG